MMMLLTVLFASLLALAVSYLVFSTAAPGEQARPELRPEPRLAVDPPRFFASDDARTAPIPEIPLAVLLSLIERHVRLEQAAAETFLAVPTPEALRSPTASPFVN